MHELRDLIGREAGLRQIASTLADYVSRVGTAVVGAQHVTCSDESEYECIRAFQRFFVEPLLPTLGLDKKAAFHTSNLGGRYEWGSARIAEQHFATPESRRDAKCVTIKINGHVSVAETPSGREYGPMERYATQSSACGALHAMLANAAAPFAEELRDTFGADGIDRIAILLDEDQVAPTHRHLFAAIAGARLQAGRAMLDVQAHTANTPTVYVIAPCVTLNRPGPDSEILVGVYVADYRPDGGGIDYWGLGDDPSRYEVGMDGDRLRVTERD